MAATAKTTHTRREASSIQKSVRMSSQPLPRVAPGSRRSPCSGHSTAGPGILLGIGLGGFVDGIVLHQILQWHHMLSDQGDYPATTVAGPETTSSGTAFFYATWIAVAVGIWILWRRTTDWRWAISGRAFVG